MEYSALLCVIGGLQVSFTKGKNGTESAGSWLWYVTLCEQVYINTPTTIATAYK